MNQNITVKGRPITGMPFSWSRVDKDTKGKEVCCKDSRANITHASREGIHLGYAKDNVTVLLTSQTSLRNLHLCLNKCQENIPTGKNFREIWI